MASIGNYVQQYQIEVDPDALRYHNHPLSRLIDAVRASNINVGAKTIESGGMEFFVQGKGFIGFGKTQEETLIQIKNTIVSTRDGVPVHIRDLAQVQLGLAFRRGALDLMVKRRSVESLSCAIGRTRVRSFNALKRKLNHSNRNWAGSKFTVCMIEPW